MAQVSNNLIVQNGVGKFMSMSSAYNHVTVVQVDETESKNFFDDEFVTVLKVGEENEVHHLKENLEEEIIIYRLPGERLGMALKFEGAFIKKI